MAASRSVVHSGARYGQAVRRGGTPAEHPGHLRWDAHVRLVYDGMYSTSMYMTTLRIPRTFQAGVARQDPDLAQKGS